MSSPHAEISDLIFYMIVWGSGLFIGELLELYVRGRLRRAGLAIRLRWGVVSGLIFAAFFLAWNSVFSIFYFKLSLFSILITLAFIGGGLNCLVMHANGGRMPVKYVDLPLSADDAAILLLTLYILEDKNVQKRIDAEADFAAQLLGRVNDPHCQLPNDPEHSMLHSETKFPFLADIFSIRIFSYVFCSSLGDILMFCAVIIAFVCFLIS